MEAQFALTPDSIKLKIASRAGREELLNVDAEEALLIILNEPCLRSKHRIRYSVTLQRLCGAFLILPDSHVISYGLEITSSSPVACGGFADVFQGVYKGRDVAIKILRIPAAEENELARLKKPQDALELCPPGNPHRPRVLSRLGSDFHDLFDYKGDLEDLNRAIDLHREELRLCPPGHLKGDLQDLNHAIELHQEQLEIRIPGHPYRWLALKNLGLDFRSLFDRNGKMGDLSVQSSYAANLSNSVPFIIPDACRL